ncbi:MerR family transcriptional regulator [Brachybacterium atlanticum]|uniref:MerR family transcriptional regulator n=1 Tax=Brachybacterium atlanticum TaxID=2911888 RepID=UPI0021E0E42E|nr:MerR family transcriptional regulator [Brachybacterium atlanticum]
MRISALSARTEVPIGTVKYYLREGLLAPGRQTSRTTAEYDESHVERIRLVRALTDAGGLDIAAVRRIVEVLDAPGPARLDLLATAQHALLADEPAPSVATGRMGAVGDDGADEPDAASPARAWLSRRGWHTYEDDLLVGRLERVWAACEAAGIQLDDELMDGYAEALVQVARLDVDTVPEDPDEAVRRVVVGTVMLEPVLLTLRLLAQRELSVRRAETVDGGRRRADSPR